MWVTRLLDFRRRRYAWQRRVVEDALRGGNEEAARTLVVQAIDRWSLNWEDGSRKSYLRDIKQVRGLLEMGVEARMAVPGDFAAAVERLRGFITDDRNYPGRADDAA